MTREEAKKNAEIMMAYAEGKTVEYSYRKENKWYSSEGTCANLNFEFTTFKYRIKPEPKPPTYRPWKPEEVPVGSLVRDNRELFSMITSCDSDRFYLIAKDSFNKFRAREVSFYYKDALTYIYKLEHSLDNGKTWQPCGVLEVPSTTNDE